MEASAVPSEEASDWSVTEMDTDSEEQGPVSEEEGSEVSTNHLERWRAMMSDLGFVDASQTDEEEEEEEDSQDSTASPREGAASYYRSTRVHVLSEYRESVSNMQSAAVRMQQCLTTYPPKGRSSYLKEKMKAARRTMDIDVGDVCMGRSTSNTYRQRRVGKVMIVTRVISPPRGRVAQHVAVVPIEDVVSVDVDAEDGSVVLHTRRSFVEAEGGSTRRDRPNEPITVSSVKRSLVATSDLKMYWSLASLATLSSGTVWEPALDMDGAVPLRDKLSDRDKPFTFVANGIASGRRTFAREDLTRNGVPVRLARASRIQTPSGWFAPQDRIFEVYAAFTGGSASRHERVEILHGIVRCCRLYEKTMAEVWVSLQDFTMFMTQTRTWGVGRCTPDNEFVRLAKEQNVDEDRCALAMEWWCFLGNAGRYAGRDVLEDVLWFTDS